MLSVHFEWSKSVYGKGLNFLFIFSFFLSTFIHQVIPIVYLITGVCGVELWQFSLLPGLSCADSFRYGICGMLEREGGGEREREREKREGGESEH